MGGGDDEKMPNERPNCGSPNPVQNVPSLFRGPNDLDLNKKEDKKLSTVLATQGADKGLGLPMVRRINKDGDLKKGAGSCYVFIKSGMVILKTVKTWNNDDGVVLQKKPDVVFVKYKNGESGAEINYFGRRIGAPKITRCNWTVWVNGLTKNDAATLNNNLAEAFEESKVVFSKLCAGHLTNAQQKQVDNQVKICKDSVAKEAEKVTKESQKLAAQIQSKTKELTECAQAAYEYYEEMSPAKKGWQKLQNQIDVLTRKWRAVEDKGKHLQMVLPSYERTATVEILLATAQADVAHVRLSSRRRRRRLFLAQYYGK